MSTLLTRVINKNENFISIDTDQYTYNLILPDLRNVMHKMYFIIDATANASVNNIVLFPFNNGQLINKANSFTILRNNGSIILLATDELNWNIIHDHASDNDIFGNIYASTITATKITAASLYGKFIGDGSELNVIIQEVEPAVEITNTLNLNSLVASTINVVNTTTDINIFSQLSTGYIKLQNALTGDTGGLYEANSNLYFKDTVIAGTRTVEKQIIRSDFTFTPSNIPGLLFWLKADDLNANDNTRVPIWSSAVGSYAATPLDALGPIYLKNRLNGYPVVLYDELANSVIRNIPALDNVNIYALISPVENENTIPIPGLQLINGSNVVASGTNLLFDFTSPGINSPLFKNNQGNVVEQIDVDPVYDWQLVSIFYDGHNFDYLDNRPVYTYNGTLFNFGSQKNNNSIVLPEFSELGINCQTRRRFMLAELIIINGEIDKIVQQKIEGYIVHKWNLKILPFSHPYTLLG